jgi:hypothetical protein
MRAEYVGKLWNNFHNARSTVHTTHEHIQTFYNYTRQCKTVCEVGIEGGFSTWGFLTGLFDNKYSVDPEEDIFYVGVDISNYPVIKECEQVCKGAGINYTFIQKNSIQVEIPQVDLLYIDSWHVYDILREN